MFIVWASIGNSVYPTNPLWIVFGMCAVGVFILFPYFREFQSFFVDTNKSEDADSQLLYHLSLACGFALLLASVLNIVQRIRPATKSSEGYFSWIFTPGIVRLESKIKQAASYKMNSLVHNACEVHKTAEFDGGISNGAVGETKYGKALLAYARTSDQTEESLGFVQTLKRMWNGKLFTQEGVWLTSHLLAANVAQLTICLLLGSIFILIYQSELFQEGLKYLDQLTGGSQRWRLMFSLFFGIAAGEITIIVIVMHYIPSTVRTILRFRTGCYESLHSKKFQKLRLAVDQSSVRAYPIFVYFHLLRFSSAHLQSLTLKSSFLDQYFGALYTHQLYLVFLPCY